MPETINQRIARFISFSTERFNDVAYIQSTSRFTLLYQRVLYLTILDALSKVVFPLSGNRTRIIEFIRSFSGWEECDRVSLPHLVRLLSLNADSSFQDLRNHANNLMSQWFSGNVVGLDQDPTVEEIRSLWPQRDGNLLPIQNTNLESLQHVHLFYNHRNSLVHEFRMLGMLGGAPDWSRPDPYYSILLMLSTEIDSEIESWELQYPIEFYQRITRNSIQSLERHLLQEAIDPISVFISGSYWIHNLNL